MTVIRLGMKLLLLLLVSSLTVADVKEEEDVYVQNEQFDESVPAPTEEVMIEDDDILYATPKPPHGSYIAETFDDIVSFGKTWIRSQAKKAGVDADISKYDGVWAVEEPSVPLLKGDRALILKSKAKHAAIAAPLNRPFKFGAKPLVVQYEVTLQDGQECGGSYLKLLSLEKGSTDLKQFQDKSPYTIMFGPDNCGNEFKLHFIFRHVNPLDGSIEEKHAKKPTAKLDEYFKDKQPHLYTLVVRPDNTFEISIDHEIINSGHLLEDFTPPVNPEKEITDPDDFKPSDWDEREKIPDPEDKKPDDWDENAPKKVEDESASIPSGWLENEPENIPDPTAEKPDDWDPDMDGEWEAPLIGNPKCEGAPGCGPWNRPMIDNPNYKGKWFPRQIANPNYRGQWVARMIPNPKYFEDLEPFKMTPISSVGFELWAISANVLFDNILITESVDDAKAFAAETFDLKISKLEKGKGSYLQRAIDYSNEKPWLYAIYVLIAAIPVVLIIMCCCASPIDRGDDGQAERKKTDAASADDTRPADEDQPADEGSSQEEEDEGESEEDGEDEHEQTEEDEEQKEEEAPKSSPRPRRRVRKD